MTFICKNYNSIKNLVAKTLNTLGLFIKTQALQILKRETLMIR